jgi:hypothetical protein
MGSSAAHRTQHAARSSPQLATSNQQAGRPATGFSVRCLISLARLAPDSFTAGPCAAPSASGASLESPGGSWLLLAVFGRTLPRSHLLHTPSPCTVAVLLASPQQLPRTLTASCRHGTVLGLSSPAIPHPLVNLPSGVHGLAPGLESPFNEIPWR